MGWSLNWNCTATSNTPQSSRPVVMEKGRWLVWHHFINAPGSTSSILALSPLSKNKLTDAVEGLKEAKLPNKFTSQVKDSFIYRLYPDFLKP
jgi:hypothetical protein